MLSYRNQFDHPLLDRHSLKSFLELLCQSNLQPLANSEERYQELVEQADPNSELERRVLAAIQARGIPLPDGSQELIEEANCKPDFIYKDAKIAIFCDGSVHDSPEQRERDRVLRENLQFALGYQVLSFPYDEDWEEVFSALQSIL